MKNLNLKVRFKNPVFIIQLGLSVLMPILTYFGLTIEQLTSWVVLIDLLWQAIQNPFVLGTIFASIWATLNDPTTKGLISDSQQALTYTEPKRDDI